MQTPLALPKVGDVEERRTSHPPQLWRIRREVKPTGEGTVMSERDAFESILAALHEVALDRSQWSRAAALNHETVGTCGSSMMFGEGADQEDVRIHFAWTFYGGERHRELERLYFDNYYLLDERVPAYEISPTDICSTTPTSTPKKKRRPRRPTTRFGRFGRVGNALNVRLDGPRGSRRSAPWALAAR